MTDVLPAVSVAEETPNTSTITVTSNGAVYASASEAISDAIAKNEAGDPIDRIEIVSSKDDPDVTYERRYLAPKIVEKHVYHTEPLLVNIDIDSKIQPILTQALPSPPLSVNEEAVNEAVVEKELATPTDVTTTIDTTLVAPAPTVAVPVPSPAVVAEPVAVSAFAAPLQSPTPPPASVSPVAPPAQEDLSTTTDSAVETEVVVDAMKSLSVDDALVPDQQEATPLAVEEAVVVEPIHIETKTVQPVIVGAELATPTEVTTESLDGRDRHDSRASWNTAQSSPDVADGDTITSSEGNVKFVSKECEIFATEPTIFASPPLATETISAGVDAMHVSDAHENQPAVAVPMQTPAVLPTTRLVKETVVLDTTEKKRSGWAKFKHHWHYYFC